MRKLRLSEDNSQTHDGGGALRWLLTYADMITLLMAFFIMLYSMSVLNMAKFNQVATSIRSGFGGILSGKGSYVLKSSGRFSLRPLEGSVDTAGVPFSVIRELNGFLDEAGQNEAVNFYSDDRGLIIEVLSDGVLFEPGRADIRTEAEPLLAQIAQTIRSLPHKVVVEGHTCDLPIRSSRFPSNWELSTSRSTNVIRFLIENEGIDPARLGAAGYADTHPVEPNISAENRRRNRRVEIVFQRPTVKEAPPPELSASSTAEPAPVP